MKLGELKSLGHNIADSLASGMGLMIGVEFVQDRTSNKPAPELRDRVEVACFERGLVILGAGTNTIRWSPPLILTKENVDVAIEIFDEAIAASV